jgi:hypothetical protein
MEVIQPKWEELRVTNSEVSSMSQVTIFEVTPPVSYQSNLPQLPGRVTELPEQIVDPAWVELQERVDALTKQRDALLRVYLDLHRINFPEKRGRLTSFFPDDYRQSGRFEQDCDLVVEAERELYPSTLQVSSEAIRTITP